MALAIFDLDNTLLAGDSDYLWGVFLAENAVVDRAQYERENARFYDEYRAGRLDIHEFLTFSLKPLADNALADLLSWRDRFVAEKIDPIITQRARDRVERHRAAGDVLMIITATNAFVTQPIADRFDIPHLIATKPEFANGRYTGRVSGTPSYRDGKVERLQEWLRHNNASLDGAWFYSDSHNDLPLLRLVDNPIAVDPDQELAEQARRRAWPVISLRDGCDRHA